MKILVVGGAGYIGSHTVRRLNQQGHQVLVFDNLCTGHRQAVPTGQLIVGELSQVDDLSRVLRENKIEAVLHFAAFALVGESVSDPASYYQNNVAGTLNLLDACVPAMFHRSFSRVPRLPTEPPSNYRSPNKHRRIQLIHMASANW